MEEYEQRYQIIQQMYAEAMGAINDMVHSVKANTNIELPKIKIPEFTGKSVEWRSFIELFDKIVHTNQNITDSIKMQYLKTCLKADAAKLVNHMAPTAENYDACYNVLRNRYDNKRELLGKLFDSILQLERHKFENSADLRTLHDTANESVLAIKNLGLDTTSWDPLINHILLSKLHRDTIKHYECQLKNIKETETLQEFLTYIESRCLAIQSAEIKSFDNNKPKFNSKDNKEKFACISCNEAHHVSKCRKFLKCDPKDRSNLIRMKKCVNCFGAHKIEDCKSKFTCKLCSKKHHSLLHFQREFKANMTRTNEGIKNEIENNVSTSANNVSCKNW